MAAAAVAQRTDRGQRSGGYEEWEFSPTPEIHRLLLCIIYHQQPNTGCVLVRACACVRARGSQCGALYKHIIWTDSAQQGGRGESWDSLGQRPHKKITCNLFRSKLESARSHLTKSSHVSRRLPPAALWGNPIPVLPHGPWPGLAEKTHPDATCTRRLMNCADVPVPIARPRLPFPLSLTGPTGQRGSVWFFIYLLFTFHVLTPSWCFK